MVGQDSVSDVLELMKKQEDLEAMIQAQSERFNALQARRTQVKYRFLILAFYFSQYLIPFLADEILPVNLTHLSNQIQKQFHAFLKMQSSTFISFDSPFLISLLFLCSPREKRR